MIDLRDHQIEIYINRSATKKIPRNAPKGAWKKFHSNWICETMGARDLAIEVYRGYSFAPCFDGRKVKEDFRCAWHLALDFDCGDERAKIENLMEDPIIESFSSFLYYTPSSHPPHYKSRVVFVFDKPVTTVEKYEAILEAFAWWYPDSDQSTTDAARFFYGSKGCELLGNWSILLQDVAREIVFDYQKENPKEDAPRKIYQPKATDEKKLSDALKSIPTRLDYLDWLKVCMGVHSAFPNSTGVRLLESWSPGYDGEIEDKFKSFDRTAKNGVTVRTVYKMAIDNGWNPPSYNGTQKRMSMAEKKQHLMTAGINDDSGFRIRGN